MVKVSLPRGNRQYMENRLEEFKSQYQTLDDLSLATEEGFKLIELDTIT
jgi:hypothetical protein